MFIVITEIKVKNLFKFPAFLKHSVRSHDQAKKAPGNIHTSLNGKRLSGYTITAWNSEADMTAFRNSGAHKTAMQEMKKISSAFRTVHYHADKAPSWQEAFAILKQKSYTYLN